MISVAYVFLLVLTAVSVCSRVVVITEEERPAYENYNAGASLHGAGDIDGAVLYYQKAIHQKFDLAEAHMNIALCYELRGDIKRSVYHHEEAILWATDSAIRVKALCNLASARHQFYSSTENSILESINILEFARSLDSNNTAVLLLLAQLMSAIRNYDEALSVLHDLVSRHPSHVLGHLNIGNHYFRVGNYRMAVEWYRATLSAGPQSVDTAVMVHNNIGACHRLMQDLEASAESYLTAFQNSAAGQVIGNGLWTVNNGPTSQEAWTISNLLAVNGLVCNWKSLEVLEAVALTAVRGMWRQHLLGLRATRDDIEMDSYGFMLNRYSSREADKHLAETNCAVHPLSHVSEQRDQKAYVRTAKTGILRVGYLSYDWKDHPMGRLTSRFVTHHNASAVFSVSFSYGPDDRSDMRFRVATHSPVFVDVENMPLSSTIADIIATHEIDVLVDLTVLTFNSRLDVPARKPAPVVINYLGFPGTSGCRAFDYALVDAVSTPPEISDSFTESLLYMPPGRRVYQGNDMPLHVPPHCDESDDQIDEWSCRIALFSNRKGGEKIATVPGSHVMLCSFNANKKLEPVSFSAWMNIMRRVPESVLVMLSGGPSSDRRVAAEASAHGISSYRLAFLVKEPWERHLKRSSGCDLVLDTYVYGAHTTASDMLWQGVPTLTLSAWGSGKMPSRVASALLQSLGGVAHLSIAMTVRDYEDLAVRLCRTSNIRRRMRTSILSQTMLTSTFNKFSLQKSLEISYRLAWDMTRIGKLRGLRRPPHIFATESSGVNNLDSKKTMICHARDMLEELLAMQAGNGVYVGTTDSDDAAGHDSLASIKAIWLRVKAALRSHDLVVDGWCELMKHIFRDPCQQAQLSVNDIDMPVISVQNGNKSSQLELSLSCSSIQITDVFGVSKGSNFVVNHTILASYVRCLRLTNSTAHELNKLIRFQKELMDKGMIVQCSNVFDILSPFLFVEVTGWPFDSVSAPFPHHEGLLSTLPLRFFNGTHTVYLPLRTLVSKEEQLIDFASILHNAGICAYLAGRKEDALYRMASSAMLNIVSGRSIVMLGTMISEMGDEESGFMVSAHGVTMMKKEELPSILYSTEKRRIVIYCDEYGQSWWTEWNRSSGLGGSEEAVIFLAEALAVDSRNQVEVYLNSWSDSTEQGIRLQQESIGAVIYLHLSQFDASRSPDVFVAWRYPISLALFPAMKTKSRRTFSMLWLHDLIPLASQPDILTSFTNIIWVPSEFHKRHVNPSLRDVVRVLPHGLSPEIHFTDVMDEKNSNDVFVYGSSPYRGLEIVLSCWGEIKRSIPSAVLYVFYGFTDSVVTELKERLGLDTYNLWRERMDVLLCQDGVIYKGMVGQKTLSDYFSKAGFILYPTSFPETGCLTVIKAMANGCIPITSRYEYSVLPELTAGFDLGPRQQLTVSLVEGGNMTAWVADWQNSVVSAWWQASHESRNDILELRRRMIAHTRNQYSWQKSADLFLSVLH